MGGVRGWVLYLLKHLLLQLEVCSEILFLYNLIIGKLIWSTVKKDSALKQKICAVGNVKSFVHVMVGYQDANVTMFQMPYYILDFLNRNRVNARKRLVEHDELRLDGKA